MEWKYTKERPLRVFEAFAGYGSQSLALRQIGIPYEVVGISEIDPYAIRAYEAIHGPTKNFGDISKINWSEVPDFNSEVIRIRRGIAAGKVSKEDILRLVGMMRGVNTNQ